MDDLYEVSMLLDFYGQMLTQRQFEILDLHYNSDYSLGEIAQHLNISRQGVYDNIKRGKTALTALEEKLGLMGRFLKQKDRAGDIMKLLEEIDVSGLDEYGAKKLKEAQQAVRAIMED